MLKVTQNKRLDNRFDAGWGNAKSLSGTGGEDVAENTFDRFSVFFTGGTVFLDGTVFPLGQLTTDVLNLNGEVLTEIDRRVNHFISVVWTLLQEKTDSAARSAHRNGSTLSGIWLLICRSTGACTWTQRLPGTCFLPCCLIRRSGWRFWTLTPRATGCLRSFSLDWNTLQRACGTSGDS